MSPESVQVYLNRTHAVKHGVRALRNVRMFNNYGMCRIRDSHGGEVELHAVREKFTDVSAESIAFIFRVEE
jgi:hypothetical protein